MPKRDETLTAFGRNVAKSRNERGFSQDKLAEAANLDAFISPAGFYGAT
ncbi:MAG TPA: hypothetical protein VMS31_05675 [Pyrinomonadaceae bacterium]|nr:hypothetical protein [Pyrinomonadaceae bacterium]